MCNERFDIMKNVRKNIETEHSEKENDSHQNEDQLEFFVDGSSKNHLVQREKTLCAVKWRNGQQIEKKQKQIQIGKFPKQSVRFQIAATNCPFRREETVCVSVFWFALFVILIGTKRFPKMITLRQI